MQRLPGLDRHADLKLVRAGVVRHALVLFLFEWHKVEDGDTFAVDADLELVRLPDRRPREQVEQFECDFVLSISGKGV